MFPTGINGQIELISLRQEHVHIVVGGIKRQLEIMKAANINQHDSILSFKGGFFPSRLLNTLNILDSVSQGKIEVLHGTPAVIKYRLSSVGMLIDVLFIALAAAIFIGITDNLLRAILVFLSVFSVLFGLNYLTAALRIRSFLRHAAIINGENPFVCPNCGSLYDPSDYRDDALEKRCAACNELLKDETSARP